MTTLFGLLNTGAGGLETSQAGLAVTGNNIANASTPGYTRRSLVVSERPGPAEGGGATVAGVERAEDFILSQGIASTAGALAQATTDSSGLGEIEAAIQAGQTTLSQRVSDLGSAFTQLAASPQDPSLRGDVLAKGTAVATEFNRVGQQLGQLQSADFEQAQNLVPQINQLATQVAALNRTAQDPAAGTLTAGSADSGGQDLTALDQRDRAASQLATLTGGQVLRNADGTLDVLVSGMSLVHGTVAQDLSLSQQGGVAQVTLGGAVLREPLTGNLGGFLSAQATAHRMLGQFDQLAYDLTGAINTQHGLGVGLDGASGRPFFQALAGPAGAAVSIALDPGLDATTVAAGLSSQPGDNRNALALANLMDQPVLEGGKATFRNVYTGIVSSLGAEIDGQKSQQTTAQGQKQAQDAEMQSVAGVSTDEETTQLLAYQRSYEASSKFISIVDQLMSNLVSLVAAT